MKKQVMFHFHKIIFWLLLFFLVSFDETQAQGICSSLKNLDKEKFSRLETIYRSAIDHSNQENSVFKGQEEKYDSAWRNYFKSLNNFLSENQFMWQDTVRCLMNIYFNEAGYADFFFYKFFDFDREDEFALLVNRFISKNKFGFSAKRKFRQCGSVTFTDKKEKD